VRENFGEGVRCIRKVEGDGVSGTRKVEKVQHAHKNSANKTETAKYSIFLLAYGAAA
jgi:hypothetical protein